jgi:tRNA 2-selenouridine synthase
MKHAARIADLQQPAQRMREPFVIEPDEALSGLDSFDRIFDARSPSEFAEDHLPGAINTPVLNDDERAMVGLANAASPFEARRIGAALVARNIASMLDSRLADLAPDASVLVYCWRGGNRSGALATVLARVGWKTAVLRGGYRGYRRQILMDLAGFPARLRLHVLAGRTGTGKSLILDRLAHLGAQVLDLERLANHRGSVLGLMPDASQPSQKRFESLLWNSLRRFEPSSPVFVESESRRIGRCHLPDALIERMRSAPCTLVDMPMPSRARLLLDEYRHLTEDADLLAEKLDRLVPLHGRETISAWQVMAGDGRWEEFVTTLLTRHYDPAYDRSLKTNYLDEGQLDTLAIASHDPADLEDAARKLMSMVAARATHVSN